jgi:predicted permease
MWPRLRSWLEAGVRRGRVERDLTDEIAFHLRERAAHWERLGASPQDALRRARLEFGATERHKEDCRRARGLAPLDAFAADVTYAGRRLRARPVFTIVTATILAVGLGANVAVFSAIDAVLWRSLPVQAPEELRELAWVQPPDAPGQMGYNGSMRPSAGGGRIATSFAYPVYEQMRDRSTAFAALFAFDRQNLNLGVSGREQRVAALLVTGNFMSGLAVPMALGRAIGPDDDRRGAPAATVLTHGSWQRLFGGDAQVIGRSITLNGTPGIVIGVTMPSFYGVEPGRPVDALTALTVVAPVLEPSRDVLRNPRYWAFRMMGRLQQGASDAQAAAEAGTLFVSSLPSDFIGTDPPTRPRLVINPGAQGLDSLRRNYSEPLYLLLAIMAAVLLVACANVTGLLLTQHAARDRELAVRLALGASRSRLVRQLLTETTLLAVMAGGLAVILAMLVAGHLLPLLNLEDEPIELALGASPLVMVFAVSLCLSVGLLCGVLPAFRGTRMGERLLSTRAIPGGAPVRSRLLGGKMLIALQVSLSLVLIVSAGLFVRTVANLRSAPLGFQPDHVLTFRMDASASGYEGSRLLDVYDRVRDAIAAMPGVSAVSFSRNGLLTGSTTRDNIALDNAPDGRSGTAVHIHHISPRHFATMGIALEAGRDFGPGDRDGAPRVAIVNQTLARLVAGGDVALGRRIRYGDAPLEIVGVVADARFASLREPITPALYLSYRQAPQHRMTFAVRVGGDPAAAAAPVRQVLERVTPDVPVFELRTQHDQINLAIHQERVFAYVATAFAALALLLASLGIYGTLAYSVAGRTSEIGLRMALGASRTRVVRLVLVESLLPVVAGIAVGLGTALSTTPLVESMLFGLEPQDVMTLAAAAGGLLAAALVAAWLPARHASRVDPMTALRCD